MTPEQIIDIVCKALELDAKKVTTKQSGNGQSKYCDARHIIAYLIRRKHIKHYTYKDIALMLGNNLSASAFYNELICSEKMKFDKVFIAKFNKVECEISQKIKLLDHK